VPLRPFPLRDRDIVGVTESLLARAQGNYATLEDIAEDVRRKVPEGDVALLSRSSAGTGSGRY
jgi:F420-0:gamma-glutamyl ligase